MFARTEDLKSLDERWHEKGRQAKRRTASLDEHSDSDILRWSLDTDSRRPTGRETDRTWQYRNEMSDETQDIRERDDR